MFLKRFYNYKKESKACALGINSIKEFFLIGMGGLIVTIKKESPFFK